MTDFTTGRRHRRNDRIQSEDNHCYSRGQGRKCVPGFRDVARNAVIHATSTCGSPVNTICHPVAATGRTRCTVCNSADHNLWHPPVYLTDKHPTNKTCWISGPVDPFGDTTVNLTISFGKRFEILYMYILPCYHLPDSVVFHKSSDFGKTWQVWRYFSKDCLRAFGKETSGDGYSYLNHNSFTPVCKQLKPLSEYMRPESDQKIVFSASSIGSDDDNPALIDWRTATDLRISMSNFGSSPPVRSRRVINNYRYNQFAANDEPEKIHYSFSELTIGGRCKCNGHANKCIVKDKRLQCACAHNTEGDDCERCKPFFYDQPWSRATEDDAYVCKVCNCNGHSKKCRFNKSAYTISQGVSGGVCIDCRHNTMGPHCEKCAAGYYRDPNRNMTDEKVCRVCNCHPLGSADQHSCDPTTGQCVCKPGVTGNACNRCKPGYQQTNDLLHPCQPVHNTLGDASATPKCGVCRSKRRRIRFKKFCRRDYAIHMVVRGRQSIGSHVKFRVSVNSVFRRRGQALRFIPHRRTSSLFLWVAKSNLVCNCPVVKLGKSYLLLSNANIFRYQGQQELILNHKSTVIPWMDSMRRKMIKFKRKEKRGHCSRPNRRLHRKRNIRNRKQRQRKKSLSRQNRQSKKKKSRKSRRRGVHYPDQQQYVQYYQRQHRGAYQGDYPVSNSDNAASSRQSRSNENYGYYGTK